MVPLNFGALGLECGLSRDTAQSLIAAVFRAAFSAISESAEVNFGFARVSFKTGSVFWWFDATFVDDVQAFENREKVFICCCAVLAVTLCFFALSHRLRVCLFVCM